MSACACRILLVAVMAISGLGCEATIQVDGNVKDLQTKPIAGAALEFSSKSGSEHFSTVSDDDGRYSARFATPPEQTKFKLTVTKPGYEDYHTEVDYTIEHRDIIMTVKKTDDEKTKGN